MSPKANFQRQAVQTGNLLIYMKIVFLKIQKTDGKLVQWNGVTQWEAKILCPYQCSVFRWCREIGFYL